MTNLYDQMKNHPGMVFYRILLQYNVSKNILSMNSFELQIFIQKLENGEIQNALGYEAFRKQFHDFDGHLIRYLHNFAAAAKTLIDHTRTIMRMEAIHPDHKVRYQEEVDSRFKTSALARFMQEFRNYIIHHGIPQTVHVTEISSVEKTSIYMELPPLLEWDAWSTLSRKFISENAPRMRILELAQNYEKLIIDFHFWFATEFTQRYKIPLEELDALQRQWNAYIQGK